MNKNQVQGKMEEAIKSGLIENIKKVICENPIDMFYEMDVNDTSKHIFHYMILRGNRSFLQFLIEKGWNINQKTIEGMPIALSLLGCPCNSTKNYLVEQGMDLSEKNVTGRTALTVAAFLVSTEHVKWLFLNGADPNIKTDEGNDLLMYLDRKMLQELLPVFLEHRERWSEENWKILKEKRLQLLMK